MTKMHRTDISCSLACMGDDHYRSNISLIRISRETNRFKMNKIRYGYTFAHFHGSYLCESILIFVISVTGDLSPID